jgi:hypothetical protein
MIAGAPNPGAVEKAPRSFWWLFLLLLICLLSGLLYFRNQIVRQTALMVLKQSGFTGVQIAQVDLGPSRLQLSKVVVAKGLALDSLVLEWPWSSDRLGYPSLLHLDQLAIFGKVDQGKFVLAGLPTTGKSSLDTSATLEPAQISIDRLLAKFLPGRISCTGCRGSVGIDGVEIPLSFTFSSVRSDTVPSAGALPKKLNLNLSLITSIADFGEGSLDVTASGELGDWQNLQIQSQLKWGLSRFEVEDWRLDDIHVYMQGAYVWREGEFSARFAKPATVDIGRVSGPVLARSLESSRLMFNKTKLPLLLWAGDKNPDNYLQMQLAPVNLPLVIKSDTDKPLAIEITTPTISIKTTEQQLSWQVHGGYVALPELAWKIEQVGSHGNFTFDSGVLEARFQTKKISSLQPSPWIAPVTVRGHLRQTSSKIDLFTFDLKGLETKELAMQVNGAYNQSRKLGHARLRMPPLIFAPGEVDLALLSPRLAEQIKDLAGSVAVSGRLNWNEKGLYGGEVLATLQEVSATASGITARGVNSSIKLLGPTFDHTPPGQHIEVGQISAGVPIEKIDLVFHLRPGQQLQLEEAALSLLDALIEADPGLWRADPQSGTTVVRLSGLNLEKVTGLLDIEGVAVTGQLSGQLPFNLSPDGLVITDGSLSTDQPGIIRLDADRVRDIAMDSGIPEIVIKALANFHYKKLSLTVNRDISGEYLVFLQAVGNNPNLDGGRQIELNLNLSGKLDEILRRILFLQEQMEAVEKRFSSQ